MHARPFAWLISLFLMCTMLTSCVKQPEHRVKIKVSEAKTSVTTFTLHVDSNFDEIQKKIVVDSFKEWEKVSVGVVRFEVSSVPWNSAEDPVVQDVEEECTYDAYVSKILSKEDKTLKRLESGGGRVLGYTVSNCEERSVVLVMDRLKNASTFANVVVHEAGHLVGLAHIPVQNHSVMYPYIDKATSCITALDAMQLCDIYECDWKQLNYCKVED